MLVKAFKPLVHGRKAGSSRLEPSAANDRRLQFSTHPACLSSCSCSHASASANSSQIIAAALARTFSVSAPPSSPASGEPADAPSSHSGSSPAGSGGGAGDSGSKFDVEEALRNLEADFAEARLEIDDALDSKGTTYFDQDAKEAKDRVKEVLDGYAALCARLPADERRNLEMRWTLKLEQLKAEVAEIDKASAS